MSIKRNNKQIAGNYVNINLPILTDQVNGMISDINNTTNTNLSNINNTTNDNLSNINNTANSHISEMNNILQQVVQIASSYGVTVGSEKIWRGETAPANYLFLDGTLYSRTEYSDLYNWAVNNNLIIEDSVWNTDKKYGLYSFGDGSTTFRVPNMTGFYLVGYDPAIHKNLGAYQDSMIPNITGSLSLRGTNSSNLIGDTTADGVFKVNTATSSGYPITGSTTLIENLVESIEFDVSQQTNTGDRVQPPSIPVKYIVCYKDIWLHA